MKDMAQIPLVVNRRNSLCSVSVEKVLLGVLLILLSFSICTYPIKADGGTSLAEPDFRFEAPRVTLGFRGGVSLNRSDGEIYDFLTDTLTLEDSDFDSFALAMDVAVRATDWADFVFGFEFTGRSKDSEYRDLQDQTGTPIEQKTRLIQFPMTISMKLYPIGRGRQVGDYAWIRSRLVPYLGGGIGGTYYELKQKGDFVDFTDGSIFEGTVESAEWGFAQHAFVGLDVMLTLNIGLVLEARYYWAQADLEQDYIDFDPISLDGTRIMLGVSWRM
jgi:opacity protein-like surface antigen